MELEELKQLWKEQSNKLDKSITLSGQVLKNIFTQKANGEIESFLRWEYFSLIEFIVFLIFISVCTYNFMDDWRFLVPGIFLMLFLASYVILSIKEIKQLNSINLYSQSVIDTKESILKFKKQGNQFMKIFLFILPLIIPSFTLLGVRFIRNINLFDYPNFFTIFTIGSIVIAYSLAFISYQIIILRKFRIIENNLAELEKFKEE
jgi:hypothetical protein